MQSLNDTNKIDQVDPERHGAIQIQRIVENGQERFVVYIPGSPPCHGRALRPGGSAGDLVPSLPYDFRASSRQHATYAGRWGPRPVEG